MTAAPAAIRTSGLTKRFGRQTVVDGVDLDVPAGAVFGFLGPNGSGKTTTIRMLLGLASATAGEISVLGERMPGKLGTVLPDVGALIEGPGFYPFLSGAANLARLDAADGWAPRATRRTRVAEALDRVGLTQAGGKKVRAYSLGMKQRLGIANALLMPRQLIVLDEPTNGLDPQGTREVRGLIRSLASTGTTVFVSSHLLAEIEQMCTHIGVMRGGRLVAQGTIDELRAAGQATLHLTVAAPDARLAVRTLAPLGVVVTSGSAAEAADASTPEVILDAEAPMASKDGDTALAAPFPDGLPPEHVVAALVGAGVRVRGVAVDRPSLEDSFVALTGEGFDVLQ
ncbi:ABC transporter ATP-binding protein [Herbiconiux flava]|uniref:ABC-2 type transport system ATP-binding protein n=1 Tax=Herbiconiux flava TaxID=881268 RepID=A0A852SIU9_9MICO|nr:ATP-binding cassette domain-containing protein [Herbiconiux flava]NYD69280.1 ABC-2 type transport system ATP-binding protein [Herbiconiux flava]GLK16026.1 ABC transporter ATP-binding protein [Herbiconiux flava]